MALTKVLTGGIADDAITSAKIPANAITDSELKLDDDYAFTGTITGAGGNNTPYFYGKKASDQAITRNTTTRITSFTTNEIDSAGAFNGTTFTVPSGQAGRYYFHMSVSTDFTGVGSDGERMLLYFYINGSSVAFNDYFIASSYNIAQYTNSFSYLGDLSVGDTAELYIYHKDGNASGNGTTNTGSFFLGYKLA